MDKNKIHWDNLLAKEMNGKLYEHVWMSFFDGKYWVHKDYYAVEDGVVYLVNNGTRQKTGDELMTTKIESVCVGEYDRSAIYKNTMAEYDHKQIKKALKLN